MIGRIAALGLCALVLPLPAGAQSFLGQGKPRPMEMPVLPPVQPVAPRAQPVEDKPLSQMDDAEFEQWRQENRWFWDKSAKTVGDLDPHNEGDVRFCRQYAISTRHAHSRDEFTEAYDPASENSCTAAGLLDDG